MKLSLLSILLLQFLAIGNSLLAQASPASFAYVLQADSLAKSKAAVIIGLLKSCHSSERRIRRTT